MENNIKISVPYGKNKSKIIVILPLNKTKTKKKKQTINKGALRFGCLLRLVMERKKMKEENFIMLPKFNKGYSNEEMFLLALSQALENKLGYVSLTFGDLINFCGVSKANQNLIVEALQELQGKKHLKVTFNGKNKNSIIIIEEIKPKLEGEKSFIQIYLWELSVFLKEVGKSKVISMFSQFAFIMGFINRNENVRQIAYPTLHSICQAIGKSERTIRNYNEELEQLNLLYSNNLVIDNETIKKVYSRFKDKNDVDEAIKEALAKGNKRISKDKLLVRDVKVNNDESNNNKSSGISETPEFNKIITRLDSYGLDFNSTLRKTINNLINHFKESKVNPEEIIISYIEKVFRDAAGASFNSKNAFVMSRLRKMEDIKKTEAALIKQQEFVPEKPVNPYDVDHHAKFWEAQNYIEEKKGGSKKSSNESNLNLRELLGLTSMFDDDDDEQAS